MQTFLPYASFDRSAACLDSKRLGKQRVEAFQIYRALTDSTYGWQHHPAVKMWRGRTRALCVYGLVMCTEWRKRGFRDSMESRFISALSTPPLALEEMKNPSWLGLSAFHSSHRAALLAKNLPHYSQFNWTETPSIDYFWPSPNTQYVCSKESFLALGT